MEVSEVASRRNLLLPLFFVFVALALIAAGYFYFQYQKTQSLLKNPNQAVETEVKALTAKVGQLIDLPKGEEPTVATVSDKEKLSDQQFFRNSQNGDKVLIYTKAKKAILYRPKTNKIIEVAPVNIGEGSSSTSETTKALPTASPKTFSAVILNGTSKAGLAATSKTTLEEKVSGLKVIRLGDTRGDFTETIVVDLKNNPEVATTIAETLSGKVDTLPKGESRPSDADFLVIVGD